MDRIKLLIIYATVLKHGSMNAAAQHLGMTASAISQHIKTLENLYQIKLLNRTTRKLVPTEAGKTLWQYALQFDELLSQTNLAMQHLRDEPVGDVKITLPTGYAKTTAMRQAIRRIRQHYPNIRLILLENNHIDDLLAHNAPDIAIRAVTEPDNDRLIARPLAIWQTLICASPDYLKTYPIEKPQDLLNAYWLNFSDGVLQNTLRHLNLPDQIPQNRTDCQNNSDTAHAFAQMGLGLAVLLSGDIADSLADGSLVAVLPEHSLPTRTIYAVTANRTQSVKIRAVLGILAEAFQTV